jgi:hypothetical protein
MTDKLTDFAEQPNAITATRIVWYLLSALTTVLLIAAAAWGTSIDTRQTAIELQQATLGQRLASIEGKLDIILQRQGFDNHQQDK